MEGGVRVLVRVLEFVLVLVPVLVLVLVRVPFLVLVLVNRYETRRISCRGVEVKAQLCSWESGVFKPSKNTNIGEFLGGGLEKRHARRKIDTRSG